MLGGYVIVDWEIGGVLSGVRMAGKKGELAAMGGRCSRCLVV